MIVYFLCRVHFQSQIFFKVNFDKVLVHFFHLWWQKKRCNIFGWNSYLWIRLRIDYCCLSILVLWWLMVTAWLLIQSCKCSHALLISLSAHIEKGICALLEATLNSRFAIIVAAIVLRILAVGTASTWSIWWSRYIDVAESCAGLRLVSMLGVIVYLGRCFHCYSLLWFVAGLRWCPGILNKLWNICWQLSTRVFNLHPGPICSLWSGFGSMLQLPRRFSGTQLCLAGYLIGSYFHFQLFLFLSFFLYELLKDLHEAFEFRFRQIINFRVASLIGFHYLLDLLYKFLEELVFEFQKSDVRLVQYIVIPTTDQIQRADGVFAGRASNLIHPISSSWLDSAEVTCWPQTTACFAARRWQILAPWVGLELRRLGLSLGALISNELALGLHRSLCKARPLDDWLLNCLEIVTETEAFSLIEDSLLLHLWQHSLFLQDYFINIPLAWQEALPNDPHLWIWDSTVMRLLHREASSWLCHHHTSSRCHNLSMWHPRWRSIAPLTRASPSVPAHLGLDLTLIWPIFNHISFELGHSPRAPQLMCWDLDELHFPFACQALPVLLFFQRIYWNLRPLHLFSEDLVFSFYILLVESAKICLKLQLWLILIKQNKCLEIFHFYFIEILIKFI